MIFLYKSVKDGSGNIWYEYDSMKENILNSNLTYILNEMLTYTYDAENSYHKNIWIDTMEEYLKNKDNSWYDLPENVVGALVNPITGQMATEGEQNTKIFYFLKGTEPSDISRDFEAVFKEENEKRVAS